MSMILKLERLKDKLLFDTQIQDALQDKVDDFVDSLDAKIQALKTEIYTNISSTMEALTTALTGMATGAMYKTTGGTIFTPGTWTKMVAIAPDSSSDNRMIDIGISLTPPTTSNYATNETYGAVAVLPASYVIIGDPTVQSIVPFRKDLLPLYVGMMMPSVLPEAMAYSASYVAAGANYYAIQDRRIRFNLGKTRIGSDGISLWLYCSNPAVTITDTSINYIAESAYTNIA